LVLRLRGLGHALRRDRPPGRRVSHRVRLARRQEDFDFEGVYNEIVEPERLVFTIVDGRPVTVTFAEDEGKTKLTLALTLETTYSEEQQCEGWTAMLVHLGEYLAAA
jgi:uncharacterized protein YndB with AHSA1/START domain